MILVNAPAFLLKVLLPFASEVGVDEASNLLRVLGPQ